jgi:hypothetical protein
MTQQPVARGTNSAPVSARAAPEFAVRFAGALLAVTVAAVHVADQGGVTLLGDPPWIGWGYRLIEVGGVLTALILLLPRPAWFGPAGWAAGSYSPSSRPPPSRAQLSGDTTAAPTGVPSGGGVRAGQELAAHRLEFGLVRIGVGDGRARRRHAEALPTQRAVLAATLGSGAAGR